MSFWAGRKVLVPGGSGFVGSHLVELLIDEGAIVTVSSRQEAPRFLADVATEVDLRHGDLEDAAFCRDIVAGQDTVLYLAAEVGGIHYNRQHHASLFASNLRKEGTVCGYNELDARKFFSQPNAYRSLPSWMSMCI